MQIVVEDVSFSYQMQEINPLWALEDISFQVDKGQFVSIIGHSGSGKSTLTMLLAGLQLPGRGRVLLNNQEAKPKSVFPHLGFVFQYPEQQL
ncbi:MAG: ATP-binding cassette domain-containing protein, partial [Clostridiales bacterium]